MIRPDSPELADAAHHWTGAYLHLPFCRRVCPYCDFNVVAGRDDLIGRYLAAVETEILGDDEWRPLDAVSFGGGTPSHTPHGIPNLLGALSARFGLADDSEVSLEANPEDWSDGVAAELLATGINRVSLGIQSFDVDILSRLGRRHGPAQAADSVRTSRRVGFGAVGVDLIYGTPSESMESWIASVDRAVDLEPDHISIYALTIELGTPFSREVRAGAPSPDQDDQADKYEAADRILTEAGYIRYEISNYAKVGHACRYNLLTWAQGEYAAFGAGAHGHRDGLRTRNIRRIDAYLSAMGSGRSPRQGEERGDAWNREQERLMLGLRRAAGVRPGWGGRLLEISEWGERLISAGILAQLGERLVVVKPLLGDEVARAVLALSPDDC